MPDQVLGSSNGTDDTAAINAAVAAAGPNSKISGPDNYVSRGARFNQPGQRIEFDMVDNQARTNGSATAYVDSPDVLFFGVNLDGGHLNSIGLRVAETASRFRWAKGQCINVRRDWDGNVNSNVSGIQIDGGIEHILQDIFIDEIRADGDFAKTTARGVRILHNSTLPKIDDVELRGVRFGRVFTGGGSNDAEAVAYQGGNEQGFTYSAPNGIRVYGCPGLNQGKRHTKMQAGGMSMKSCIGHWTNEDDGHSGFAGLQGAIDSECSLCYFVTESSYHDAMIVMFGQVAGGPAVTPHNQLMRGILLHADTGVTNMQMPIYAAHAATVPQNSGFENIYLSSSPGTSFKNVARCANGWPANMAGMIWDNVDASNATIVGAEFFNG